MTDKLVRPDASQTMRSRSSPLVPAPASLFGTLILAAFAAVTGAAAPVAAVVTVLGVVSIALYALGNPRLLRLSAFKQLDMTLAAAEKAEKVVVEVRELAASLVNLQLESYAQLGRIGGPSADNLRAAAIEADKKLRALGCTNDEVERAVHPSYKYIRRDHGLTPVQRTYAEAAKKGGVDYARDGTLADALKEFGKVYIADPSPEELATQLKKLDEAIGVNASTDEQVRAALAEHRRLWEERPAPRSTT